MLFISLKFVHVGFPYLQSSMVLPGSTCSTCTYLPQQTPYMCMHVPASSVCMGLTHACPSEFVIRSAKGKGNTSVSLNLDSLTYQISGLEPYTVYNVSIAAVTGGGASNFSSPEQGQTFTSRKQPICELPSRTVGTPTYKCAQFWSWCICSEFRSFKDEQYMLYQIDSSSCLGTRLCPMLTLTRPYTYGVCKIHRRRSRSGWSGFNRTTFPQEIDGRYHNNNKHVRACACGSSMQC